MTGQFLNLKRNTSTCFKPVVNIQAQKADPKYNQKSLKI